MARKRWIILIVAIVSLAATVFIAFESAAHRLSLSRSDLVRLSWRMLVGPRARPLTTRVFERTPQRIERGRYLAEGLLACFRCHSDRDWNSPGAPPAAGKKGAGHISQDNSELVVPNITPDVETGAGSWTDDMLARAIREGAGHDGRALHPQMWYHIFRFLSDEDLASVVVYLRSIPRVHNPLPRIHLSLRRRLLIADDPEPLTQTVPFPDPDLTRWMYQSNHYSPYEEYFRRPASDPARQGEYLVEIADCAGCHTAWETLNENGEPSAGNFGGGNILHDENLPDVASANITPDPSGISYYDQALFVKVMRTGTVGARKLSPHMPWGYYRNLSDDDLKFIFAYLRTLKPAKHRVDNAEPPTYCKVCRGRHGGGEWN
jgi:mono/diheme cytochrome c family protein